MSTTRDRAFERFVAIPIDDTIRFLSIIRDIPRNDVIRHTRVANGLAYYLVKVKKQELLMIKLSIKVKSITKPRTKRIPMFI